MGRIAAGVLVALAVLAGGRAAQAERGDDGSLVAGEVGRALDLDLARCVPFGFSGAVLVVHGGELVLARGYGIADRETGTPVAPGTLFDAGSLAEALTAVAVLRLEQEKRLKTKDTLEEFLHDVPSDKKKIQLHHLLTHTSGLPWRVPGLGPGLTEREELVRLLMRVSLLDTPGADHVTSPAGYVLLAAVVETVTGQPFEQALTELVLRPAGMDATAFRGAAPADAPAARGRMSSDEPLPAGASAQHFPKLELVPEERELATEGWYSWGLRGAGGVLTTIEDLHRFEQALAGDALLTKASRKKAFTPALDGQAYGWIAQREKRITRFENLSWTPNGFAARCVRSPDEGVYVLVLSNTPDTAAAVEVRIRERLAGRGPESPLEAHPLTPEALAALAGDYAHPGGALWRVAAHDGGLLLEARTPAAFAQLGVAPTGEQKHALDESDELLAALVAGDSARLRRIDGSERLDGIVAWWRELVGAAGVRRCERLGLRRDRTGTDEVVFRLELERGEELLHVRWYSGYLVGLRTAAPWATRVHFVPVSATDFAAYDLVRGAALGSASFDGSGGLGLTLPGGQRDLVRQ